MVQVPPRCEDSWQAIARLTEFLSLRSREAQIEVLPADASSRRYFRLSWQDETAIAAVYSEPFSPGMGGFIEATRLMHSAGLPAPVILDVDEALGVIIQEDLGSRSLRLAVEMSDPEMGRGLLCQAVDLISRIQEATCLALELGASSSHRTLDEPRFHFEYRYFQKHFLEHFGNGVLRWCSGAEEELLLLASELAAQPRVLCHRDYHIDNLLIDPSGRMCVVDYQDACLGPATYDLASLLSDRQHTVPMERERNELAARFFNLKKKDDGLRRELELASIQRGFLALGVFAFQTVVHGRGSIYGPYIPSTLEHMRRSLATIGAFPALEASCESWLKLFGKASASEISARAGSHK